MIKVYLWTVMFPGHASMGWWNNEDKALATQKMYFSWWPSKAKNLVKQSLGRVPPRTPANYLSDKLKESETARKATSADAKFVFNHLDEQPILDYWRQLIESEDNEGKYQYLKHNCSTTVAHALNAGKPGVDFPRHRIWRPENVLAYCMSIAESSGVASLRTDEKLRTVSFQEKKDRDKLLTQSEKAIWSTLKVKPKYRTSWTWEDAEPGGVD